MITVLSFFWLMCKELWMMNMDFKELQHVEHKYSNLLWQASPLLQTKQFEPRKNISHCCFTHSVPYKPMSQVDYHLTKRPKRLFVWDCCTFEHFWTLHLCAHTGFLYKSVLSDHNLFGLHSWETLLWWQSWKMWILFVISWKGGTASSNSVYWPSHPLWPWTKGRSFVGPNSSSDFGPSGLVLLDTWMVDIGWAYFGMEPRSEESAVREKTAGESL